MRKKNIAYLGIFHKYFRQHTSSAKVERSYMSSVFLSRCFVLIFTLALYVKVHIIYLCWNETKVCFGSTSMQMEYAIFRMSLAVHCVKHASDFFSSPEQKVRVNFSAHLLSVRLSINSSHLLLTYLKEYAIYIQSNLAQIFSVEGESK